MIDSNLLRGLGLDRRIILISENRELFKSLKRVLDFENIIPVTESNNLRYYINNDKDIILFFSKSRDELYKLLWEEIRIHGRFTNPFMAIGFHRNASTNDLRDLIFEKNEPKHYHRYIQISGNMIEELEDCIRALVPINGSLDALTEKYCDWKGILYLILTHDVPNAIRAGNKNKAIALLNKLSDVLTLLGCFGNIFCSITDFKTEIEDSDLNIEYDNFIKQSEELWEALNE
jgi:hypothetical protein